MPLFFSKRSGRRKASRSPSPERGDVLPNHHYQHQEPENNNTPLHFSPSLRSRRQQPQYNNNNDGMVLPLTHTPSPARRKQTTTANNFLLGGYICIRWPLGRLLSSGGGPSLSHHRGGGKTGFDWLLSDTTTLLSKSNVAPLKVEQKMAEQLADERRQSRNNIFRLEVLEQLVPNWYLRNNNDHIRSKRHSAKQEKEEQEQSHDNNEEHNHGRQPLLPHMDHHHQHQHRHHAEPPERHTTNEEEKEGSRQHQQERRKEQQHLEEEKKEQRADQTVSQQHDQDVDGDNAKKKKDVDENRHIHHLPNKDRVSKTNNNNNTDSIRTLQNLDKNWNLHHHCPTNLLNDTATTLVVQASIDRVWVLLDETCTRWTDPIVAVVAVSRAEDEETLAGWKDKCPQMKLIIHQLDEDGGGGSRPPEMYPVNVLRNMALDAVETSHILMVDVDFVPSRNLQDTIRQHVLLPATNNDEQAEDDSAAKQAIVVPAFERILDPPCTSDQDCMRHLQQNSSFIPQTFEDLQHCYYKTKDCIVFQKRDNWEGHSSTRSELWLQRKWFDDDQHKSIRTIPCLDSVRYEPYVVIPWCPMSTTGTKTAETVGQHLDGKSTNNNDNNSSSNNGGVLVRPHPLAPYYDERFHGYGKNKIQYISHLRFLGYQFRVLPEGFIVHNPHPESAVKERWNDMKKSKLHIDMDVLYRDFLRELIHKYYDVYSDVIVDQCQP